MAVTITARPTRTDEALTSRWTAAHNPVIYKFQRRDRDISSVSESSGWLRLLMPDPSGLSVGDTVYINTFRYKGAVRIEATSVSAVWVSGLPYTGTDGAGYMNELSKRNYRIAINVYESGSDKLLGATSCVPFTDGSGKKDLGIYVAAYLKLVPTFEYDAVNKRDTNASLRFYITYQELWTGGSSDVFNDSVNYIYAVNAARQIGDSFGQNMHPYVLAYPTIRTAKFLTKFKRPVYFKGEPFSVGFIHSELLDVNLVKVETLLNINKAELAEGYDTLDVEQRESVNALMLAGDYASNVKYIRLKITSGEPAAPTYVYPGYVTDGYVAQL
jgi:hypothetical protein